MSAERPIDLPKTELFDIPENVYRLDEYVNKVAVPRGDLRRGQVEGLINTVEAFKNGERVVYIEQASGYGKSRFLDEVSTGYQGKQVYIVPGKTASDNIAGKLFVEGKEYGKFDGNNKNPNANITIATMPSLERLFSRISENTHTSEDLKYARALFSADIIFPDELHHFLTQKSLRVLTTFLRSNPKSVMVGVTATDWFNEVKNAEVQFGKCVHRVSLEEAREEGVLIDPRVRFVRTGQSLDKSYSASNGYITFSPEVSLGKRIDVLIDAWKDSCKKEGKPLMTVAYASSINEANLIEEKLANEGIPSQIITGQTKDRSTIYDSLKRGDTQIIVTVQTAIESLDIPELEAILVSVQTRSMRVARQMFPRPMRNIEGKKNPWIIQAIDENTLNRNKPILVTNILNVKRFVNGSVVVPRRYDEIYDHSLLQLDYSRNGKRGELTDGQEVDIITEVIDVDSLFRIGLLEKAQMVGAGLLGLDEENKLRKFIIDLVQNKYGSLERMEYYSMTGIKIHDEVADSTISLAVLVRGLFGEKNTNELSSDSFAKLKEFLYGVPISKVGKVSVVERDIHETFVHPFLAELCYGYKKGSLAEEDNKVLASILREIIETNNTSVFTGEALKFTSTKHKYMTGPFYKVIARMGLQLREEGFRELLEFINLHSEGNLLSLKFGQKDESKFEIPAQTDFAGNTKDFLRRVILQAVKEGFSLTNIYSLQSYQIDTPEFKGTFYMLLRAMGMQQKKTNYIGRELRNLIDYADN